MVKSNENQNEENYVTSSVVSLLRPFIRFLLAKGITYISFIKLVRPLYIEIADNEFRLKNTKPTDSRISLLTGIARRYIRELRDEGDALRAPSPRVSPAAKLVGLWTTQRRYMDKQRIPKALPRLKTQAKGPSFEELANLTSSDIRPKTLLDNLLERQLVEVTDDDYVILLSAAYQPDENIEDLYAIFSMHMHDHLSAATSNLITRESLFLERSAYQDKLTLKSIKEIDRYAEKESMKLLQKVYAKALACSEKDSENSENHYRYRLGVYGFSDTDSDVKKNKDSHIDNVS